MSPQKFWDFGIYILSFFDTSNIYMVGYLDLKVRGMFTSSFKILFVLMFTRTGLWPPYLRVEVVVVGEGGLLRFKIHRDVNGCSLLTISLSYCLPEPAFGLCIPRWW